MQGMILFSALGGELLVRYRIRARPPRHAAAAQPPEATRVNNSILVVVLASGDRVRHAAPLRGAR